MQNCLNFSLQTDFIMQLDRAFCIEFFFIQIFLPDFEFQNLKGYARSLCLKAAHLPLLPPSFSLIFSLLVVFKIQI